MELGSVPVVEGTSDQELYVSHGLLSNGHIELQAILGVETLHPCRANHVQPVDVGWTMEDLVGVLEGECLLHPLLPKVDTRAEPWALALLVLLGTCKIFKFI